MMITAPGRSPLKSSLVLIALSLLPLASAGACRFIEVPVPQRFASADGVYVGIVTGKRLTGLEERLRAGGDEGTIVVPEEYELRVLVRRTLKGRSKTAIDVPIASCASGSADLMENVIVFMGYDGIVLRPKEETLKALRDTPKD